MPDAKIMGIGHGSASNASRASQMTSRFVRTRDHTAGRILSQKAGGQVSRKETGIQANRVAAQDGKAATGTTSVGG